MKLKQTPTGKHEMENRSIKSLRSILSDIADPVFVVDPASNVVVVANKAASSVRFSSGPEGKLLSSAVHFETGGKEPILAYFNNQWLVPVKKQITWKKKIYTKLMLTHTASTPDENTLFTIRKMIAVLVHRLRSPMTGMQGYLEMVEDIPNRNNKRKLAKVGEGLDYLFEIMDELELLHNVEAFIDDEPNTIFSDAEIITKELLYSYPEDLQNRIQIVNHTDKKFQFNPSELNRIISLLLNNAAEHPSAIDKPIRVEIISPRKISITNFGSVIPDEIVDHLYFPFTTTKANNLGIGLSLAQLIASRRHAAIMLTENSPILGITFTLICRPAATSFN